MRDIPSQYRDTQKTMEAYIKREGWTVEEIKEWVIKENQRIENQRIIVERL